MTRAVPFATAAAALWVAVSGLVACTSAESTARSGSGRSVATTGSPPTRVATTPIDGGSATPGAGTSASGGASLDASAPGSAPPTLDAGVVGAARDGGPSGPVLDGGAGHVAAGASYATVVRAADWARWPGLPAALRERDLVRDLRLGRATSRRDTRLGRHDAVVVDVGGVRYWLRDRDHVVLVEITVGLGSAPPTELLAALGAADREGAGRFLQSGATTTEHVFAGRGLAVTVAASYDTPPAFASRLAAVQLFAVTDLRTFVLELGGNDRGGPVR